MSNVIELQNITRSYQMGATLQTVLHQVSFTIARGEMVALMGASGSGKSTIMNIIGLLDKANDGRYLLNGDDVSTLSDDAMAAIRNQTIGFIFQQFFLLPRLTATQNIALPLLYRNTPKNDIKRLVDAMLDRVGMSDRAHHRPAELSGGQQQRVALARALVGNPSIILADEPTGALDSTTGREVMNLFHELNQQEGRTLLIVTHDKDIAAQCSRQITISDGRLC